MFGSSPLRLLSATLSALALAAVAPAAARADGPTHELKKGEPKVSSQQFRLLAVSSG